VQKRKLIEVALPLEAINKESAREKSIRHGHPSTLHMWWARRPLAATRAILFAQLVDDPSSDPEKFPTEELQRAERERLHNLIERLVVWENIRDEKLWADAHAEILKSTNGNPPAILDPFAGGGAIPLEAQRLGLEAQASDLNPVAVLINKALIEIPPKFRDQPPVYPGLADSQIRDWRRAEGLAADVRAYGDWIESEAKKQIGHIYPTVDGNTVIAWIWARSVICPNPACGIELPLARSWWLSKKAGQEVFAVPKVVRNSSHPSGHRVTFEISHDKVGPEVDGSVSGRAGAVCVACSSAVRLDYVKREGAGGRLGAILMAVVAEGHRRRTYHAPTDEHISAASVPMPDEYPDGQLAANSRYMVPTLYGMTSTAMQFTPRQMVALTTFAGLVGEARKQIIEDGGSPEYATAVATYLALIQSKMTNLSSSATTWMSDRAAFREAFARQALPITWDFAEANTLSASGGGWSTFLDKEAKVIELLPMGPGRAVQADASNREFSPFLISTDPPYYDNVPYADLSDYFYVWLRWTLRSLYPQLLSTVLVPKLEELVADKDRQNGKHGAKEFFESGFRRVFEKARKDALDDFPITVYYAFRQSDSDDDGQASSGWETLLEGMVRGGWSITATWPVRTEGAGRIRALGSNALASSIVLSLRPRPDEAPTTDRRGFIANLEAELPDALRKLQQGQIAPVDLPQAAIGPGMAVYSRFAAVLEPDGSKMSVRSALARINEILDQVLNEQEGDFDATTRFAIAWYRQHGYGIGKFGDADSLARARNTSVEGMDRDEILNSRAGNVQLIKPTDLPWTYNVRKDSHTSTWEALHHLIRVLERDGIAPAGSFLQAALSRPDVDGDLIKELAHLLFRIAEGNGWTKDALSFNSLVSSWPEILDVARMQNKPTAAQDAFDFDLVEDDE
jgi:putative DNA methylase